MKKGADMEQRYDVAIIEIKTGKVSAIIGKNLDELGSERRIMTGLSRINDNYFVDKKPTGFWATKSEEIV